MSVRVTSHGKKRMQERVNVYNNYKMTIRNVMNKGKTVDYYKGAFYYYLTRRKKGYIRVYNNRIYVFGSRYNKKRLITVFPVPEKYLPLDKYEINADIKRMVKVINEKVGMKVSITLKNDKVILGTSCPYEGLSQMAIRIKTLDDKYLTIRGTKLKDFNILN